MCLCVCVLFNTFLDIWTISSGAKFNNKLRWDYKFSAKIVRLSYVKLMIKDDQENSRYVETVQASRYTRKLIMPCLFRSY